MEGEESSNNSVLAKVSFMCRCGWITNRVLSSLLTYPESVIPGLRDKQQQKQKQKQKLKPKPKITIIVIIITA